MKDTQNENQKAEEVEEELEEIKEEVEDLKEELEELKEDLEEAFDDEEDDIDDEDDFFQELVNLIGESVLVITEAPQLNLLGQTFRPIFCGPIVEVEHSHITIDPVTIKIMNAQFYQFPTPLSIPLEKIAQLTPCFDCSTRFPLV